MHHQHPGEGGASSYSLHRGGAYHTADSSWILPPGRSASPGNTISQKGTLGDVDFAWDILPNPSGG